MIKSSLKKLYIFFIVFIVFFDKQAGIRCNISGTSRPISSHDDNATYQVIAMDKYQS